MVKETWMVIGAIFGAGLFWSGLTFWAVKTILGTHFERVESLVGSNAQAQAEKNREHEDEIRDLVRELSMHKTDSEARFRSNEEHIHTLDKELLKLRGQLHDRLAEAYVNRREFEEVKAWMDDIRKSLQNLMMKVNGAT